ncbi:winged helix-turn-helix domain-containing protein [Streptomyces mirabilis]|uniref:winged helix-turn-helix domain-containing protein n=1 Tax=Streptomyces mirabilis TaxID=68239 RepID=UPI00371C3A56
MPRARACPASVTCEDREALAALLDESARQGRTWTAAALCDWLAEERDVRVSAAWLTELLHRDGFRWKRTRDTLRHKADPVLQQAARAQLEDLRLYGWTCTRREEPVLPSSAATSPAASTTASAPKVNGTSKPCSLARRRANVLGSRA